MNFYIYKDAASEWRWFLYAANNKKLADSGEGYKNKADCLAAIGLVKACANAGVREV
jgi:uncharacterized protein YegP (UPF0339 family)